MRRAIFFLGLIGFAIQLIGQDIKVKSLDEILRPVDTLEFFTIEDFASLIIANHPIVRQAQMMTDNALEEVRLARGAFDPKLKAMWDVKRFDEKNYWNKLESELKIPVWFPIDPKIAFNRNEGQFLNPENAIPQGDDFMQITAGVSLPIGKGLFIDQRRADVKQAELFTQMTDAERIKMINKVLLSAAKAYWTWFYHYYDFRLVDESMAISEEIYRRVKVDFEFGEAAVVDTVQAAITYQNRMSERQEALINYRRASLTLSNFLWNQDFVPLELGDHMIPNLDVNSLRFNEIPLDSLATQALIQHPELRKFGVKLQQLDVSERLAKENLKPRIDLNYNFINAPVSPNGNSSGINFTDNYKFGVAFEFPIFLRKERAKLRQTRIKIDQTSFERDLKQQEIVNGVAAAYFDLSNSQEMIRIIQSAVQNYQILLEAELLNLELGDSDLFKINFQQDKLLEAQVKLLKLVSDVEKARAELYWAAGFDYLKFEAPQEPIESN